MNQAHRTQYGESGETEREREREQDYVILNLLTRAHTPSLPSLSTPTYSTRPPKQEGKYGHQLSRGGGVLSPNKGNDGS